MNKKIEPQAYRYYNCNPLRRFTDDCVVRAVSSSTGMEWDETMRELAESAIKTGYMLNTPENYGRYLEERGYVKQKQPVHKDGTKVKFHEFVKVFDGHAVAHCGRGHVTYVADNYVWDIWDVSDEIVGNYWVCEEELPLVKKVVG